MSLSDSLGDMLTRIRNGHEVVGRRSFARLPLRTNVLEVLKREGLSVISAGRNSSGLAN